MHISSCHTCVTCVIPNHLKKIRLKNMHLNSNYDFFPFFSQKMPFLAVYPQKLKNYNFLSYRKGVSSL